MSDYFCDRTTAVVEVIGLTIGGNYTNTKSRDVAGRSERSTSCPTAATICRVSNRFHVGILCCHGYGCCVGGLTRTGTPPISKDASPTVAGSLAGNLDIHMDNSFRSLGMAQFAVYIVAGFTLGISTINASGNMLTVLRYRSTIDMRAGCVLIESCRRSAGRSGNSNSIAGS